MDNFISVPPLIGPPDNIDNSTILDQVQGAPSSDWSKLNTTGGNRFEHWTPKSTASAAVKLFLRGVKESADAFPLLKSVVGGLCFILDNCEVWQFSGTFHPQHSQTPQQTKVNKQAIESLVPRVKALSASLCKPVSEGGSKEGTRRKELEQ